MAKLTAADQRALIVEAENLSSIELEIVDELERGIRGDSWPWEGPDTELVHADRDHRREQALLDELFSFDFEHYDDEWPLDPHLSKDWLYEPDFTDFDEDVEDPDDVY